MNILLINDNPVVTKLVTLSAQKTGDALEVVNAIEQIDAGAYDLLIFDNELFDPMLYDALTSRVTFAKKLYMGSRGIDKPDDFDIMVNKPFLPTDLVDLFTDISHDLETESSEETSIFEEVSLDEAIDLDDAINDLEDDLELDESIDLDTIDDLEHDEEIDLDTAIEALGDEHDVTQEFVEEASEPQETDMPDTSLETANAEQELPDDTLQESVLDKDDLEEVQALLEEDETMPVAEETISEEEEAMEETVPEEELIVEEEVTLSTEDEMTLPDDHLDLLEETLEDAVDNLSEDELNAPVDEAMLLDIVNDESSAFDEFDTLDINAVRSALGETDDAVVQEQCDRDALEQVEEELLAAESHEPPKQHSDTDSNNGIETLKAVLSALQNEEVAGSLKAMNITINISFGEK